MQKNRFELVGGYCPKNLSQGFFQKTGQCWIDGTQMALIFGGSTSNHIIKSILEYTPDILDAKIRAGGNMMPINFEQTEEELRFLIDNSYTFISHLKIRLIQILKKTQNPEDNSTNKRFREDLQNQGTILDLTVRTAMRSTPLGLSALSRQNSYVSSLCSDYSIKYLSNHNLHNELELQQIVVTKGTPIDIQWLINFYNFLFMSENEYIYPIYSDVVKNFTYYEHGKGYGYPDGKGEIYLNPYLLNNCFAILITITMEFGSTILSHLISLFECFDENMNNSFWLYDNEGIDSSDTPLTNYNWKDIIIRNNYALKLNIMPFDKKNWTIESFIVLFKNNKPFNRNIYYASQSDYVKSYKNNTATELNGMIDRQPEDNNTGDKFIYDHKKMFLDSKLKYLDPVSDAYRQTNTELARHNMVINQPAGLMIRPQDEQEMLTIKEKGHSINQILEREHGSASAVSSASDASQMVQEPLVVSQPSTSRDSVSPVISSAGLKRRPRPPTGTKRKTDETTTGYKYIKYKMKYLNLLQKIQF